MNSFLYLFHHSIFMRRVAGVAVLRDRKHSCLPFVSAADDISLSLLRIPTNNIMNFVHRVAFSHPLTLYQRPAFLFDK